MVAAPPWMSLGPQNAWSVVIFLKNNIPSSLGNISQKVQIKNKPLPQCARLGSFEKTVPHGLQRKKLMPHSKGSETHQRSIAWLLKHHLALMIPIRVLSGYWQPYLWIPICWTWKYFHKHVYGLLETHATFEQSQHPVAHLPKDAFGCPTATRHNLSTCVQPKGVLFGLDMFFKLSMLMFECLRIIFLSESLRNGTVLEVLKVATSAKQNIFWPDGRKGFFPRDRPERNCKFGQTSLWWLKRWANVLDCFGVTIVFNAATLTTETVFESLEVALEGCGILI